MDIKLAAEKTRALLKNNRKKWPIEKQFGTSQPDSYDHIEWMLIGIESGYIQHEQAHRWLGWAQAVICIHQGVGLDEFKLINKNS